MPRRIRVVLANDVQLELEIERTFLQRSGFLVRTAPDGPSALALALSEKPDIVVLDQVMPGMTGIEVCVALKARPDSRGIPVIISSAYDTEQLRRGCAACGADAFVPKAAGREALLEVIARLLRIPERRVLRIAVCLKVDPGGDGREALGRTADLSEGGMRLETNRRHEVGTRLLLRFIPPGARGELTLRGRVRSVQVRGNDAFALEVEFLDLTADERRRLNEFLDRSFSSAGPGRPGR